MKRHSSFTSELHVTPEPNGRLWRLTRSFRYHVGSKYSKEIISVHRGFETDFASIELWGLSSLILLLVYIIISTFLPWWMSVVFLFPAILYLALPKWAKYSKPSVLHDFLYQHHLYSRHMSDLIFYEAMLVAFKSYRTGGLIAFAFYEAVRWFGYFSYKGGTK